jgi:hypothetical protein
LVFNAYSNSTSKCGIENKYNLFSNNGDLYFAGVFGHNIIWRGFIWEMNSVTKGLQIIGTIIIDHFSREDFIIRGFRLITCTVSGTNETVTKHVKYTNVSKEERIFCKIDLKSYPSLFILITRPTCTGFRYCGSKTAAPRRKI